MRATFKRSGLIRMKRKATLIIGEGSMILKGIAELHLINQRRQTGFERCRVNLSIITPTTLVCVHFDPTITTYFYNF